MGVVTTNRQRVAYHEAGHAVMTLLLHERLRCVTNLKLGPEIEGISYTSPRSSDTLDVGAVLEHHF
jgi:ATP-dependent Zn protease